MEKYESLCQVSRVDPIKASSIKDHDRRFGASPVLKGAPETSPDDGGFVAGKIAELVGIAGAYRREILAGVTISG